MKRQEKEITKTKQQQQQVNNETRRTKTANKQTSEVTIGYYRLL